MAADDKAEPRRRSGLARATANAMREMILKAEPETRIGSLHELADSLGVGIVTIQQAARILEHEGLLDVRRGPGGGYYGRRPDKASLEPLIEAFIRHHPVGYAEALDIVTLLFCELVAAASDCPDGILTEELEGLLEQLDDYETLQRPGVFEEKLQTLLFRMVNRPLFEMLTTVALHLYGDESTFPFYEGEAGLRTWQAGRQRLITAILSHDAELARFEAQRHRKLLLERFSEIGRQAASVANVG